MVKAYLRYEAAGSWGVVASAGGVAFDDSGRLLATACLERVGVWSLKQGQETRMLSPPADASAPAPPPQVSVLARGAAGKLAAGYSDGSLRQWGLSSGECELTLQGHKSAVSALRYSRGAGLCASGGRDTDVCVWDVLAEAGLFRLKGHRDEVTDLAWAGAEEGAEGALLISSSKDGHVRVWDVGAQACVQTLTGHRCAVWALDIDPGRTRLLTGAADSQLRLFSLDPLRAPAGEVLSPLGAVARPSGGAAERVAALRYDPSGRYVAVAAAGRLVEVWGVAGAEEAARRARRRRKRRREKGLEEEGGDEAAPPAAADELRLLCTLPLKHKALALAFSPRPARGALATLALTLGSNEAAAFDLHPSDGAAEEGPAARAAELRRTGEVLLPGHRADVRCCALSEDDALLMSASHSGVKFWNPLTGACLRSASGGYGLCCAFAPGGRYALVGTKAGGVEIFDVAAASLARTLEGAHAGPVWSLALQPGGKGFVSGGGDKEVKFWEFTLDAGEGGGRSLGARHARTLRLTEDVLSVRFSPDGKLLLAALLDATVKVFFADSLKFFLSLYGHKLPALALDVSSDGQLCATGGADKNIKLWGLDFGDCHRSIFAHSDSVTALAFVPGTHYLFSASKDRTVKYWDGDSFEPLLTLRGHAGEVWGLAVSRAGDFLVSAGHDRSLRRWARSEEPFFVEEEKERRLESLFDEGLLEEGPQPAAAAAAEEAPAPAQVGLAGRRTVATLSAAEALVEALEAAEAEVLRLMEHEAAADKARAAGLPPPAAAFTPNPLLLGLSPAAYVRKAVSAVRSSELEQALLLLPFPSALQLLDYLPHWLAESPIGCELVCSVATLLLRLHQRQLAGSAAARDPLARLRALLRPRLLALRDQLGFNLAAAEGLARATRTAAEEAEV